ncbi:hypothetical protein LguiB_027478 [Lonicera macranthoides]
MDLESAGGLAIHTIISKLGPNDTAAVACVSKRFRVYASDDSHWSKFCADDLHLSSPQNPNENPTNSFKEAYQTWRDSFHMYPWSLVKRVKRCWGRLQSWLAVNFPEALGTLRKGASEDEINELEKCFKVKLPLLTRVIYRFCDGQEVPSIELIDHMRGASLGLIGGYCFYDHMVNVFLNLKTNKEMVPCVPNSLLMSVHVSQGGEQQDAMLLWLEEHGRRLETGFIKLREENKFRSICQFPEQAYLCSTAVTNGVQVRALALFVPEYSAIQHELEIYFSYSIRMSLLPEGCIVNGMSFGTCQLYWRRWLIRANDDVLSDVNGEAVIGKFPLLRPGEKEFVYQSCTPLPVSSGSVEGSFTFVPGRLADPKGSPFESFPRPSIFNSFCQKQLPIHRHSSVFSQQNYSSRTATSQFSYPMIILGFLHRFQWSASTKSSCINPLSSQSCCSHALLGGVHKSSKIKKILRDRNGNVGSNASGIVIVHPSSPALQSAALSLSSDQFNLLDAVQHCVHGISGSDSSPFLIFIFPFQHSIQSSSTAVTVLADSAIHTAAIFLFHKAIIGSSLYTHNVFQNWLFCKALGVVGYEARIGVTYRKRKRFRYTPISIEYAFIYTDSKSATSPLSQLQSFRPHAPSGVPHAPPAMTHAPHAPPFLQSFPPLLQCPTTLPQPSSTVTNPIPSVVQHFNTPNQSSMVEITQILAQQMQQQQQTMLQLLSRLSNNPSSSPHNHTVVTAPAAMHSGFSAENRQEHGISATNNHAVALPSFQVIPQHSNNILSQGESGSVGTMAVCKISPPGGESLCQKSSNACTYVTTTHISGPSCITAPPQLSNESPNVPSHSHCTDQVQPEILNLPVSKAKLNTEHSHSLDVALVRLLQQQKCDAAQAFSSIDTSVNLDPPILQHSDSLPILPNQHMPDKTTISSLVSHDFQPRKNSIFEPSFHTSIAPPFTQQFSVLPSGPGGAPSSTTVQQAQSSATLQSHLAKKKQHSVHINTDTIPPVSLNPISTNPQITTMDPQPDLTAQKPNNTPGKMDIASSSYVINKEGSACSHIHLQTGPTHTVALHVEPSFNCHILNEECPTPTFLLSSPLHNYSSQSNSKHNDSQSVESFVPNTEPDQSNPKHKQNSQQHHISTNKFAPLSGKFWGDEEDEPPIQTFVHSADEIMEETDPHQCIQLGEDIDQSVLNQETPENMKNTGYLSSLYSDSSPSLNYNIHSPTDSSYSPHKDSNHLSSSPSIPLLTYPTNKAKNKQAKKIQKEMEEMVKAGIPQASIDCLRHRFLLQFCWKCHYSVTFNYYASQLQFTTQSKNRQLHFHSTDIRACSHNLHCCYSEILLLRAQIGGVNKSPMYKEILRDRNGFVDYRNRASGVAADHSKPSFLLFAIHSLSSANPNLSALDQLCVHGILGYGSSPQLNCIYSVQHSIQSTSVATLADYADFSAATVLCFGGEPHTPSNLYLHFHSYGMPLTPLGR